MKSFYFIFLWVGFFFLRTYHQGKTFKKESQVTKSEPELLAVYGDLSFLGK